MSTEKMKKVVMKLDLRDDKEKQKAMKAISGLSGIDSIAVDMKEKKMTVVGEVDPVEIVEKLRKLWSTEIVSVGPAKEEKKAEPKKDEEKGKDPNEQIAELARAYRAYNTIHYHPLSVEENPNSCVIS